MNQAGDRQPRLEPLHEAALRLIGRMSAHACTPECVDGGLDRDDFLRIVIPL
jgi:hypothetical protein